MTKKEFVDYATSIGARYKDIKSHIEGFDEIKKLLPDMSYEKYFCKENFCPDIIADEYFLDREAEKRAQKEEQLCKEWCERWIKKEDTQTEALKSRYESKEE